MSILHVICFIRITDRQNFHLRNVFFYKPGFCLRRSYSHLCFSGPNLNLMVKMLVEADSFSVYGRVYELELISVKHVTKK